MGGGFDNTDGVVFALFDDTDGVVLALFFSLSLSYCSALSVLRTTLLPRALLSIAAAAAAAFPLRVAGAMVTTTSSSFMVNHSKGVSRSRCR